MDPNIPVMVLPDTIWSFQLLNWVPYLWHAEAPKKVLWSTFFSKRTDEGEGGWIWSWQPSEQFQVRSEGTTGDIGAPCLNQAFITSSVMMMSCWEVQMMSSDQCLGQLRSHITGKTKAQSGIQMLKAKEKGARVTQACLKEHLICAWKDNFLCVCLPVSSVPLFLAIQKNT